MEYICFLLVTLVLVEAQGQIGCRDENGDPVDWFIVYKLPRQNISQPSASSPLRGSGFEYLYMDGSTNGQWKLSNISIKDQGHAVAYTLEHNYKNQNNASVFRLLYNDAFPNGTWTMIQGHSKGALVFDSTSGFWMIHSVPKFPTKESYGYPASGGKFGQVFFCITFSYSSLGEIANQLFLNEPYIFDYSLPDDMARDYETLAKVVKGQNQTDGPFTRETSLTSAGGLKLTSFAKSGQWGQEVYVDLVAPALSRGLYAETWQNNQGNLGSNCTAQFPVSNVATLSLLPDLNFSIHNDHSKWAVSTESISIFEKDGEWICIGDTNRQEDQFSRGGGTMCMQNAEVWKTFRGSIRTVEVCK